MIKVNNNQKLIVYKKIEQKNIEYNIKMINENFIEFALIYIENCITNSDLLELQQRLDKIENELIRNKINTKANEYQIRMNKLQHAQDNNEIKEYIENLTYEEIEQYVLDFTKEDVELTEQGRKIAELLNEKLKSMQSTLEPIQIPQIKK